MRSLENPEAPPQPGKGIRVVQSLTRACAILKTLARTGRPLSLGDIARAIDTSKPATYHLLGTLALEGLVVKTPDLRYELGWSLWELGSAVVRSTDLARTARFHLDRIAEQTDMAALLSVRDRHSVIYLDRGQPSDGFKLIANTGRRSSLHANASGKTLLAYAPEELIEEVLATPLRAFTSNTITEPEKLRVELASIREAGYAGCWQEQELGMSSVAVPIRDFTGAVVAALALAAPAARVNKRSSARLVALLLDEATQISMKLGATPPLARR